MKRYILWCAAAFAVGCGGAANDEAHGFRGVIDYSTCGQGTCEPGYTAASIHLEACGPSAAELNATRCTTSPALAASWKVVRSQEIPDPPPNKDVLPPPPDDAGVAAQEIPDPPPEDNKGVAAQEIPDPPPEKNVKAQEIPDPPPNKD